MLALRQYHARHRLHNKKILCEIDAHDFLTFSQCPPPLLRTAASRFGGQPHSRIWGNTPRYGRGRRGGFRGSLRPPAVEGANR